MNVLILTQYYPPEVGAPQNRLSDLAMRLSHMGIKVQVLTSMPNYPQMKVHEGYKRRFYVKEELEGVNVHRSWIYVSKSKKILPRLLNYFSFVFSSLLVGLFRTGRFDYILVESPPLFLGISGYLLKAVKRCKMIFNVSDLWPESAEKLGIVNSGFFLRLSYGLEAFLYKKSFLITGQTMGIINSIHKRFPDRELFWFPNGIDPGAFDPQMKPTGWRTNNGFNESDFILLYAGIVGHAQGLETLIMAARILKDDNEVKIVILGSGPEKTHLQKMAEEYEVPNVIFLDIVSKKNMPGILRDIDVAYIPLKKLDLFLGAIPSKIFESLAMEKPILLGVDGEARRLFIEEGKCGVYVEPENPDKLAAEVKRMKDNPRQRKDQGIRGREYILKNFNRQTIAADFLKRIQALSGELIDPDDF